MANYNRSSKSVPTDDMLVDNWCNLVPNTVFGLGEFRRHANGIWFPVPEKTIENEIYQVLEFAKVDGVRPTIHRLRSVLELARIKKYISDNQWDNFTDLIPLQNGEYSLDQGILLPYAYWHYYTSIIPVIYDPNAKCPNFQRALDTTIPAEKDFFLEFAGYALTQDTSHEIALWLYGPPGSGKSTLLHGLEVVFGPRMGVLGLLDIERSRFALSSIIGKTLLMSTEQPRMKINYGGNILNSLISGEPVLIEKKFQDQIEVIPKAKFLWAMNELPEIGNSQQGIYRRIKIIEFPPLPQSQRNLKLKDEISNEAPGILNLLLEAVQRLRNRGEFEIPKSVQQATAKFQSANDLIREFVSDRCDIGVGYKFAGGLLYSLYKDWCYANGYKPESNNVFAERLNQLGFQNKKINGRSVWEGLKIK